MTDEHKQLATKIVAFLNECHQLDPTWTRSLIEGDWPCNGSIAKHPTLPVRWSQFTENYAAGVIGFLNGLVGQHPGTNMGLVGVIYKEVGMGRSLEGFCLTNPEANA